MNCAKLLRNIQQDDKYREKISEAVHSVLKEYCNENQVTLDDISDDDLEQLSRGIVARGISTNHSSKSEPVQFGGDLRDRPTRRTQSGDDDADI